MNNEPLKFPDGQFTHAEVAKFNDQTPPQIWGRFQKAIKDGVIVFSAKRPQPDGKRGKPSNLYTVTTGNPIPVKVVVVEEVAKKFVVEAVKKLTETIETIETETISPIKPAQAPKVKDNDIVIEVQPTISFDNNKDKATQSEVKSEARVTDKKCPMCSNLLRSIDDATGVLVWCAQPQDICKPQDVSAHGRNEKIAYETLVDKWNFSLKHTR